MIYGLPVTNVTPLANYANIINNNVRDEGHILAYNISDRSNILNKQLLNNDIITTLGEDKIWCTSSYINAGKKYYNLQIVNEVVVPRRN